MIQAGIVILAAVCGAAACGAAISAAGTAVVRRWSRSRGFVDRPGGHKGHASPVALGGGVAVTLAVVGPMAGGVLLAWMWTDAVPSWIPAELGVHFSGIAAKAPVAGGIVAAAAFMCIVGLIDDARPLSAWIKLSAQIAVAAFLVLVCDLRLLSMLGNVPSIALTMLWILTLINAFNFLDNMDGLASGVAMIAAAVFALTAMLAGQIFVPTCCWLLVGALAGFLPYNFHPASVFLGDAGSMVIGLLLAVFTILTTFVDPSGNAEPFVVLTPLVVMAVPLYDTASVVFLRLRLGVPIWSGDRRHFSHRLLRRGMSVRRAVLVIWLATLTTALPAVILSRADWELGGIVMLQTVLVVGLVACMEAGGPGDEKTTQA